MGLHPVALFQLFPREQASLAVSLPSQQSLNEMTQELTRFLMNEAFRLSGGSRQGASRLLGISRYSLKRCVAASGYNEKD